MHFVFIPYGPRLWVEVLLRDMEAQKHKLRVWKTGEEDKFTWVSGVIRILPFGVMEYVFPKENLRNVLGTLLPAMRPEWNHTPGDRYMIGKVRKFLLQKIFKTRPIPEDYHNPEKDAIFLWLKEHVNIIPIGLRDDVEITEKMGGFEGWSHEAL